MSLLRARDEIRTRDPHVGNVMLYQLSYSRILSENLVQLNILRQSNFWEKF